MFFDDSLLRQLTKLRKPSRRTMLEYTADYSDLFLDGQHWQAQFGGSSNPGKSHLGAYMCFASLSFAVFRTFMALVAAGMLYARFWEFQIRYQHPWAALLYFQNWVLALVAVYFALAACHTTAAVLCLSPARARHTPASVWVTWAAYGCLLPAALVSAALSSFLTVDHGANEPLAAATGLDGDLVSTVSFATEACT
jgi:hypothetical protein